MDPLVSVVIPNHNYAAYVGQAVESVLGQTRSDVEIIVVDNGSLDDSLEVLGAYRDRCEVIAQPDLGQSAARNRGIEVSHGEFIAFLDADDIWRADKLERQLALFESDPAIALVYCSLEVVDRDLRPTGETVRAEVRGDALDAFARWPGRAIVTGGESTAVVRRSALRDVGVFETSLSISGGWDLWRRIATHHRIDLVDEPLVLNRRHGSNLTRRLAAYERDVRAASARMFADPAAHRIQRHRRRYDAGLDLMFAKAWLRAGNPARATTLLLRSFATRITPGVPANRA